MTELHGIIFAYHASRALGELTSCRTSASIPFCGRYRLIDFALSSMQNAGVRDVGVIMRSDYQSLLDHLGSGKTWDLSRKRGGLRLLPPFGRAETRFSGIIEALCSVESYIRDIKQEYVLLARGNLAANVDVSAVMERHLRSGADLTVVCAPVTPDEPHGIFWTGRDTFQKFYSGKLQENTVTRRWKCTYCQKNCCCISWSKAPPPAGANSIGTP